MMQRYNLLFLSTSVDINPKKLIGKGFKKSRPFVVMLRMNTQNLKMKWNNTTITCIKYRNREKKRDSVSLSLYSLFLKKEKIKIKTV